MRRRPRLDTTQNPIREVFHAFGWLTESLAALGNGVTDILALSPTRQLYIIEAKTGNAPLTEAQERFRAKGWPVVILRSPADAEAFIRQERAA